MPSLTTITTCALAALSTFLPVVSGHSWIEEFQVIDSKNGSYIGDRGYSRGYMARTDPGYNGFVMDYLVPSVNNRINASDSLCHPSQRTSNYTNPAYPKLKVTPGSYVAMKYLENGHVTLPWNQLGKPPGAGSVFVYGTTQPSDDEKIVDVLHWSRDGKGGNGKGFLMTSQNFDDGRCHQINCGNISTDRQIVYPAHVEGQPTSSVEQWCETDLHIPKSQPAGTLTVYWVWQWPTEPGHDCTYPDGKDEYYTTCADFEIEASNGNVDAPIIAEPDTHTLAQENPQSTAVADFKSRVAITNSPPIIMLSGTKTIGQTLKATNSAFAAQCSASGNQAPSASVPAQCGPVSEFSGAAYTSASNVLKQYATTNGLAHPAAATPAVAPPAAATSAPVATSQPTSAPAGATPSSYAPPPVRPAASADSSSESAPATVTVTDYTTIATTFTTSVPMASSAAPADSSVSASAASSAPLASNSGNGIAFPTISTATAPVPGAASSAAAAPHVAADGMVEDVVVNTSNHVAGEHSHAHRRWHARHFR